MRFATASYFFCALYGEERGLERLAETGFDSVDYSMHLHQERKTGLLDLPEREIKAYYRGLYQAARSAGIGICQIHAPFPSYVGDPVRDEEIYKTLEKSIVCCAELHSPYVVIHLQIPKARIYDEFREETFLLNKSLFSRLMPMLKDYDVRVGVENMFSHDPVTRHACPTACATAEEMIEYIDRLNDLAGEERFVACLDTGHANVLKFDPAEMVKKLGTRLRLVHVHDNNGQNDDHLPPYSGMINWDAFNQSLLDAGYPGDYSFEVTVRDYADEGSQARLLEIGKRMFVQE